MAYQLSGDQLARNKPASIPKFGKDGQAKKPKLGTGARFKAVANPIEKEYEKKGKSPAEAKRIAGATAAKIGRESLGAKKFNKLATEGRMRHAPAKRQSFD